MEKVAQRIDAPLVPERGLTTSSVVEADLRDRIRSLLISRNRRYPPKTPCTTPDYTYQTRDPDKNTFNDHPSTVPQTYTFSPAQAIAKLTRLTYEPRDMGATRFDGPAGQIGNDDADTSPRRPSQPSRQNGRDSTLEGPHSYASPGLNQRSHADILGREAFIDNLKRTSSVTSKASTATRKPRFHLRTVPPAVDVNKVTRPTPLHVPGSYRSEVPSKQEQVSQVTSRTSDDRSEIMSYDTLAVPKYAGSGDESSHRAIDVLTKVAEHDHIVTDRPGLVLHKAASHEKPGSTGPTKQSQDLLVERRADESVLSQAAQPILTSNSGHDLSQDDPPNAPVYTLGDDKEKRVSQAPLDLNECSESDPLPYRGEASDPLDGPKISDLLAQLPPVRKSTIKHVSTNHLSAEPLLAPEKASTERYSPSVSSLESVPLNTDEGVLSQDFPLLPKSSQIDPPVKDKQEDKFDSYVDKISAVGHQNPSQKSPKLSTASRAMSMLSEISARTGLQAPSLSSMTRRRQRGSTTNSNLTTKPRRHFKYAPHDPGMLSGGKGYKTLSDDIEVEGLGNVYSKERLLALRNQQKNGTGFTKLIQDLESLLNQALTIAGQAADKDDGENTPLKPDHINHVHDRTHSTESIDSSPGLYSLSGVGDEEDNYSSLPPQQVIIEEPKSDAFYHGHSKKAWDATPHPAQTGQASTVPYAETDHGTDMKQQASNQLLEIPNASKTGGQIGKPSRESSFTANDWAVIRAPSHTSKRRVEMKPPPRAPQTPPNVQPSTKEQHALLLRAHGASESTLSREVVRDYVISHHQPPAQPRLSSRRLKQGRAPEPEELNLPEPDISDGESDCEHVPYVADFKTAGLNYHPVYRESMAGDGHYTARPGGRGFQPRQDTAASLRDADDKKETSHRRVRSAEKDYTLNDRHHLSIREPHGFSLSRSHRRSPIARDWSTSRKRYVATVTCITTAFMGMIVGIYAGEVPAIQYAIADEHHYTILGNVLFFLGLAITTALFYPLPLLHGRKPYTLAALAILLPLQFPQALAINSQRDPNVATYRIGLLLPRIMAGMVMGFANINFITTLLDLFGASLQSSNPHQETVNVNDVRRHGGGMGLWLGVWTWCAIGSIGTGFLIGAGIISGLDVSWGFWIIIIVNAAVLVLNILTPEVRRSAYRRSMAEVRNGGEVSRRVARGEIKMHLKSTGPIWWWEEVIAGHVLAIQMLLQPGFAILSLYLGWIYGQVVLVIVVSLSWRLGGFEAYDFKAPWGFTVQVLPLPSPIRGSGRRHHPSWRSLCHTLPESLVVQSIKASCAKDRQHDI